MDREYGLERMRRLVEATKLTQNRINEERGIEKLGYRIVEDLNKPYNPSPKTTSPRCTCGQPSNLWTVHRADGPCFQYTSMDLAVLERTSDDVERYLTTFAHIHVNKGDGTDTCKQCGLDLRDQMHWPKWINLNYEYRLRATRKEMGDES